MDFKTFKEQRKTMAQSLAKLNEKKDYNKDNNIYFPTADENGNCYAIIRLLPQKDTQKLPIQTIYKHKYNTNGKNISLLCPSTFGTMKDCPLCQEAYAEYLEKTRNGIKKPEVLSYRKGTQIANILVVKDSNKPELNGKVMRMYIPFQLQQKIQSKLFPPTDKNGAYLREPEMVHDLWEGRNIILSISKNKFGYNDYTNCEFEAEKSPVASTEEGIEQIYNQIIDLMPDKSKMENPDTIVEKWHSIIGIKPMKLEDSNQLEVSAKKMDMMKEEKLEKEFSFDETKETISSSSSDDSDDEDLPWD